MVNRVKFPKPGKSFKKKSSKKAPLDFKGELKKTRIIVNEFIRARDCIKTTGVPFWGKCVTCGRIVQNSNGKGDAGHFIKVNHFAVTFHPKNIHFQCRKCNSFEGGQEAEYSNFIIKTYGMETFEWLLSKKFIPRKFTIDELRNLQEVFSNNLDELIRNFPEYKRKSPHVKKN